MIEMDEKAKTVVVEKPAKEPTNRDSEPEVVINPADTGLSVVTNLASRATESPAADSTHIQVSPPTGESSNDIGREVSAGYCWLCGEEKRYRIAEGYQLVPLTHLTCDPKRSR